MTAGPATQPSCPIAHANDSTPEPMTAVMICDVAVQKVPASAQIFCKAAIIIIKALGIVGLQIYCFGFLLSSRLDFQLRVLPEVLPLLNLKKGGIHMEEVKQR